MSANNVPLTPAVLRNDPDDLRFPALAPHNLIPTASASFEAGLGAWADGNATISRVLTQAWHGVASGQVVCPGSVVNEYVQLTLAGLPLRTHQAAARIKGPLGARVYLNLFDGVASAVANHVCTGDWDRVETPERLLAGSSITLYVATSLTGPAQAITFWIDAIQLERAPVSDDYVEGAAEGPTHPEVDIYPASALVSGAVAKNIPVTPA